MVWSFGYSGDEFPDFAQAYWEAFEVAWDAQLPSVNTIKQRITSGYRPFLSEMFSWTAGGPALDVYTKPDANPSSASQRPTEIQMAVSRMVQTPRGIAPRGRLFIGPWGGSNQLPGLRPTTGEMNDACDFMVALHNQTQVQMLGQPVVLGRTAANLTSGIPIVGYRTDDIWDTQRRRGLAQRTTTVSRTPA